MAVNIITTEDLMEFKLELLSSFKELLSTQSRGQMKKWMKSQEVRELLSISPGTLQTLRINGTLPFSKIGGVIYYDYNEIVKVFEQNKIHNKF